MGPMNAEGAAPVDGTPLKPDDFAVLGRIALMHSTPSLPEGVDHALDVLRVGAGADISELFLLDSGGAELLLTGCTGPDTPAFCTQERFDLGRGYPGIVAAARSAIITRDLQRDPRYLRREVQALGYHSAAAVPVIRGDRLLGTLHLAWKRGAPDLDRGARLLGAAAPVVATALVAALGELAGDPCDGSGLSEAALKAQAERFRRFAGADAASVVLLSADGHGVSGCGSTGAHHILCERLASEGAQGCPTTVPKMRGIVLQGRRAGWPVPCRTLPRGFSRLIGVPLRDGTTEVGVVYLGWHKEPPGPSTRFLAPLLSLGRRLAPELRADPPKHSLPAVLPPVTAAGTHHLRLQCFGPFTVFVDGHLVHRRSFSRAKAVDLLKMLILRQGRPISRDALVERLWPDAELEAGARSLHVAMHALRRAVEPEVEGRQWEHVLSRGDSFLVDLGSNCSLDLQDWRQLLAASHAAEARGEDLTEVIAPLDRALALFRGELFADDQDAEWCLAEREAYRDQHLGALLRLSDLAGRQGAADRALSTLRQASQVDPLREDVHRRLIRALWDAGRVEDARRQYSHCEQILRSEVGTRPGAKTRELGALLGQVPVHDAGLGLCK